MAIATIPYTLIKKQSDNILYTIKQLETHRSVLSTAATDVLLLKHQAIGIRSADKAFIV